MEQVVLCNYVKKQIDGHLLEWSDRYSPAKVFEKRGINCVDNGLVCSIGQSQNNQSGGVRGSSPSLQIVHIAVVAIAKKAEHQ